MTDAITDEAGRTLAGDLLRRTVVGYLAVHDDAGPYVVPISFAYTGGSVYFHGGPGRKSEALAGDPLVSLAATGPVDFVRGPEPCNDNFAYESAVASGRAVLLTDDAAREEALRAIVAKYDPEGADGALKPASLRRTLVYRVDVTELSYKRNPEA